MWELGFGLAGGGRTGVGIIRTPYTDGVITKRGYGVYICANLDYRSWPGMLHTGLCYSHRRRHNYIINAKYISIGYVL